MRKLLFPLILLALLGFGPPAALADPIALQEYLINVNGTTYHNDLAIPGLNSAAFDSSTGLGTLTLTYYGLGASFFDVFFDLQLGVPFYNEYGSGWHNLPLGQANQPGMTGQIDDPWFGTIYGNTEADTLDNANHVAGTTSNYLGNCAIGGCNGDVSMALGFHFDIPADSHAIIQVHASPTPPATAAYLLQTHPTDPNNATETNIAFWGTVDIVPNGVIPEPGTWLLCGLGLAAGLGAVRRRLPGRN